VEELVSRNLNILNKAKEPNVISNRKEVIDLTLRTDKIGDIVTNWNYCRHGINWMVMLNHCAMDCSLLPATF
jgi:hypothetical protein